MVEGREEAENSNVKQSSDLLYSIWHLVRSSCLCLRTPLPHVGLRSFSSVSVNSFATSSFVEVKLVDGYVGPISLSFLHFDEPLPLLRAKEILFRSSKNRYKFSPEQRARER